MGRSWGSSWKISTRLVATFSLLVALLLAVAAVGLWRLRSQATALDRLVSVRYALVEKAGVCVQTTEANVRAGWQQYLFPDLYPPARLAALDGVLAENAKKCSAAIEWLDHSVTTPRERELLEVIATLRAPYQATRGLVKKLFAEGRRGEAAVVFEGELIPRLEGYRQAWGNVVALEKEYMVEAVAEEAARTRAASVLVLGLAALAVLLASGLAVLLTRSIARPLEKLSAVALRIAGGDLTEDVSVSGQDEVGMLAESFRRMLLRLREIVSTLQAKSLGLATSAERLSGHTRAQSALLERQASSVTETSTTTRELEQTAAVAAERAASVLAVAKRAGAMSDSGQSSAERGAEELARLQRTIDDIVGESGHLLDQTRQVGDIVETVRDLATQSHVLSLNASIEAARAGDAGQGFAVVAREVRALAEQSGQSAGRIRVMIEGILAAVQVTRTRTEQGKGDMASSLGQIRASAESLRAIGEIVKETSDAALQIASAVQQQSIGIGQIAVAMRDLDMGMEETVVRIRDLDGSAQQVAQAATQISGIAAAFRIR